MRITEHIRKVLRRRIYERSASDHKQSPESRLLSRDGIVIIPSYFTGDALRDMQCMFQSIIQYRSVDKYDQIQFGENYFMEPFWKAANDPKLISILSSYWGRKVGITGFAGKRLFSCDPFVPMEYDAFLWHHDNEHKRPRMLVYLTDVGERDQRMEYLAGTHCVEWRTTDIPRVTFTEEAEAVKCCGPAGTVVLFDANGIHRGVRTDGNVRDGINVRYQADHWLRWTSGPLPSRPFIRDFVHIC